MEGEKVLVLAGNCPTKPSGDRGTWFQPEVSEETPWDFAGSGGRNVALARGINRVSRALPAEALEDGADRHELVGGT